MCVEFAKGPVVLTEERTMFKWAPWGRSQWTPDRRGQIPGWGNYDRGQELVYDIGTNVKSPSGPGIMGYTNRPRYGGSGGWLEMSIPAGATVYEGNDDGRPVLAASEVRVLARLKLDHP